MKTKTLLALIVVFLYSAVFFSNRTFAQSSEETSKHKSKMIPFSKLKFTDIGVATQTGKATIIKNELEVRAGGADIWGKKDEFYFGYLTLKGDFDLRVRVTSLGASHLYTKAGIMARADLSDSSQHVYF